jgi:hypothetical protein
MGRIQDGIKEQVSLLAITLDTTVLEKIYILGRRFVEGMLS